MVHLVTGGAGFVACNLIGRLLDRGHSVVALDNLSRGRSEFLQPFVETGRVMFHVVDCADRAAMTAAFRAVGGPGTVTDVWHLAANSDIPAGVADPQVDLKDTFLTTFETLVAMKEFGAKRLHFASSSAIYGDFGTASIHEGMAPYRPISNYGAMKLASEAQIAAACESFLERANVFRFPNVVGVPATHGVMIDFVRRLKTQPDRLEVLGNGTQQKIYLHVDELVSAMLHIADHATGKLNILNIGPTDEGVTVRFIAETVRDAAAPNASIGYGAENRGWVGDVPKFRYDVGALTKLGWRTGLDSAGAVRRAVAEIVAQESVN